VNSDRASVGRRTIVQRAAAVETAENPARRITANVVGTNVRLNFRWRGVVAVNVHLLAFQSIVISNNLRQEA